MADPNKLLDQLSETSQKSFSDETSRIDALTKARQLVQRLETPTEATLRMMWTDPAINMSLKVCCDLKVFQLLESGPKSTDELAKATGSDPALLRRFLRQLAAATYVKEKDVDVWGSTELTSAMVHGFDCTSDMLFGICMPAYEAVPPYLKSISWKNPDDRQNGAWQRGHKTDLPFFDWLAAHPESSTVFNNTMRTTQSGRVPWFDIYPVQERFISRFDPSLSEVLFVDVGGGVGHETERFYKAYPDVRGTLIVQDLESVVSQAQLDPRIKTQSHSFFDPQPVKGAMVYYMGSILHDWPDPECRQILSHLKGAMRPGYSRILLREPVIPAKDATLLNTSMDIIMMTLLASKERSRKDWDELVEGVGLKITNSWQDPNGLRHVIEIVLEGDVV